jgi:hypothetical protein
VATGGGAARDPEAELRTRRALQQLQKIVNDLIFNGDIELGPNGWTPSSSSGPVVLAGRVFGDGLALSVVPGLPHPEDASAALASRVFASRVSYGVVG